MTIEKMFRPPDFYNLGSNMQEPSKVVEMDFIEQRNDFAFFQIVTYELVLCRALKCWNILPDNDQQTMCYFLISFSLNADLHPDNEILLEV